MDNNNTINNYNNAHHTMNNPSSNINNANSIDPFKDISRKDSKNDGPSFFSVYFGHSYIQSFEEELQELNSNKADDAKTSSAVSEARFRFLSFHASKIVGVSLSSLFTGMLAFIFMVYYMKSYFIAYLTLFVFLSHSFFPGYISYLMKRHVKGERFTERFYKKVLAAWHGYESIYIFNIFITFFLSTIHWVNVKKMIMLDLENGTGIFKKLSLKILSIINLEKLNIILEHLTIALLLGLIVYIFLALYSNSKATTEQEEVNDEHLKEKYRPITIARQKAGKLKID